MTAPPPGSGYVAKAVPRSAKEAISQKSADRVKTITKSAVQHYISKFLSTTGESRSFIEAIAPQGLNYITDKSFDETLDQTKRHTQLARLYNEVSEKAPAILIIDAGLEWQEPGLGQVQNAKLTHDEAGQLKAWQGRFQIVARVPLTLAVVTLDQDSTDTLQNVLLLMFSQFRNTVSGSRLASERQQDNWEVRLPMAVTPGPNAPTNITEDKKDSKWTTTIDMVVEFEDTFLWEQDFVNFDEEIRAVTNDGTGPGNTPPVITVPDTIQVNTPTAFSIDLLQDKHRIMVDRPGVATIDLVNFRINPRRLGTFKLQVYNQQARDENRNLMAAEVVAEKEITVVL